MSRIYTARMLLLFCIAGISQFACDRSSGSLEPSGQTLRERVMLADGWRFFKYESISHADDLVYDVRPGVLDDEDGKAADAVPTKKVEIESNQKVLKSWILPTGNRFIANPNNWNKRPYGNPGSDFPFVQADFDDSQWQKVSIPHDWAIAGPFFEGVDPEVGGGMGRLPSPGVGWYRKQLDIEAPDSGKSIFLDVDGAMSYAIVWLNGYLVGGWPYGYASWRVDLTPYVEYGGINQLAIRLDNPSASARWYSGGGLYRNVWLTKTNPIHVAQWGTYITTSDATVDSATVNISIEVFNESDNNAKIDVITDIYTLDQKGNRSREAVAHIGPLSALAEAGNKRKVFGSAIIKKPRLWGPPPNQSPNRYLAVTTLKQGEKAIDQYDTFFGIRDLRFDSNRGLLVNGEHVPIRGANLHHDLGALGAAFNVRAAERQLQKLQEMGVNAIRTAHNPPAAELLDLTDKMGLLVVDEIFDVWERKKTPLDFHLIFSDWREPDLRAFVRRDRNHPSVIVWSFGNEVGEQYTGEAGADLAKRLHDIVKEEDPTRPTTASMNYAKPHMPMPASMDLITLNYQGEGIRNAPGYAHLTGIRTMPLYPAFHKAFPDKVIISSENAAALSSRGEYLFPVTKDISAPIADGLGGDPVSRQVSAYELYTAPFGSSVDKVFASLEKHPFVAGGMMWSGWDYLGEPTPYYSARSSYFGVIDLAGFKKDRFYLYQAHWRPELPMVHILPHWNWSDRIGKITPVHIFTSGDEVELFLNGSSLGKKKKKPFEYRLRWDEVKYQPGELKAVAYRNGKEWAIESVRTTSNAQRLALSMDRSVIKADGHDLSFVSVRIVDNEGLVVPTANHMLRFSIAGPGEIVATDNGDPTDFTSFKSQERKAFNGLCLAIVRAKKGSAGIISLTVTSKHLQDADTDIIVKTSL